MHISSYIFVVVVSYIFGSTPSGYLAGKARGIDVRTVGSGNIGATNVFRVLGKTAGAIVLLGDAFKGFVAARFFPLLAAHIFVNSSAPRENLALAAGGDTYKLRYGHRSQNQPVQDLLTRRCYITSQNHGYAVRDESLPADWEPWFVNVNDGTNEGIRARNRPVSSVQFHPEARPGPEDTGFLFDDFLRLAGSLARGR